MNTLGWDWSPYRDLLVRGEWNGISMEWNNSVLGKEVMILVTKCLGKEEMQLRKYEEKSFGDHMTERRLWKEQKEEMMNGPGDNGVKPSNWGKN